MKLASFIHKGNERVGMVDGAEVIPIPGFASMEDLIRAGIPAEPAGPGIPLEDVRLLAPIPRPSRDVICLGMNFADHTKEAAKFHPTLVREHHAVYFSKHVIGEAGIYRKHKLQGRRGRRSQTAGWWTAIRT